MNSYNPYLDAEVATIYVVAQEEVARLCRVAADFEQLHEIVVLAVDITTDGDGRIHLQQIRFCLQDLGALLDDP
jgi:hypothetical protein